MPQPLRSLSAEYNLTIGGLPPTSLIERPHLASLAMTALGAFSHVEVFQLNAFIQMMGGPADKASRIFLKLDSRASKTSAILVAASDLSPELQKLLQALLKVTAAEQKRRDKLAHHSWGHIPERDDVLLLRDPRSAAVSADPASGIYVYTEADFQSMIDDFHRVGGFWGKFNHALIGPEEITARRYAQLSQEPALAEILDRQARQD